MSKSKIFKKSCKVYKEHLDMLSMQTRVSRVLPHTQKLRAAQALRDLTRLKAQRMLVKTHLILSKDLQNWNKKKL